MNELLIIYNTCGISGRDNSGYYYLAIDSILNQTFKNYKLIISGCSLLNSTKGNLERWFKKKSDFIWVDNIYPVPVTFNLSVLRGIEKYGKFCGYLYIDSGCQFGKANDLQQFFQGFKSHNDCGMYSARVDEDSGYFDWFGIGKHKFDTSCDEQLFNGKDFIVPVGKTCNLHTQIFSNSLIKYYGRPYPDIFAGHCSESVFSFICAAIKQKMIINKDIIVHHERLDGQSSGFNPISWEIAGKRRWEHPYLVDSVISRVASSEAKRLGLGYEEMQNISKHDETCYDENGYCKNEILKKYVKDNLYLSQDLLNYESIKYEYII